MNRIGLSYSLGTLAVAAVLATGCGGSDQNQQAQNPQGFQGQPGQQPGGWQQQPGQPGGWQQQPGQPGGWQQQPGQPGMQPGPQPGQPGPQPGQPGPQPGQPGAQPGQPGAQPGGLPFPIPGMGGQPGGGGAAGGTAQALDPATTGAAAAVPLGMFANTEAPGMAKDGPMVVGTFSPGQTLEGAFTFQPGKCYTLVGAGLGVSQVELEMQYSTPIPGLAPTIGKSSQKSAQVSIGGKNNCLRPISPFPAQAKFIVRAVAGQGLVAAQLYSK